MLQRDVWQERDRGPAKFRGPRAGPLAVCRPASACWLSLSSGYGGCGYCWEHCNCTAQSRRRPCDVFQHLGVGRAQTQPPIIGYLAQGTAEGSAAWLATARKGLAESGIVEGRDVTSEFRSASNIADRLPALAAELVQRRVSVIVALANVSTARAAKAIGVDIPATLLARADQVIE